MIAQNYDVVAVDILHERVAMLNACKSPIIDAKLEDFIAHKALKLSATTDHKAAYTDADFVIVATPTNYDAYSNYFDTSSVETVIQLVRSVNS